MKWIVRSGTDYYARVGGLPTFVQSRRKAMIFRNRRYAQGMVYILQNRGIQAVVEPLGTSLVTDKKGRS